MVFLKLVEQKAKQLGRQILWSLPVAVVSGSLVALFLWLLDAVTGIRWKHPWLLFFLPLAGLLIHFIYTRFGKGTEAGNNLVIEEIHEPGGGVPARMAPFVLLTTLLTHLFGGSAGREGTAVQMGGSIADQWSRWFRLSHTDRRILLLCGMSAGFGAVFGTPLAGAVFALEVLAVGRLDYKGFIPCLLAGFIADWVCRVYGIHHTQYQVAFAQHEASFFSLPAIEPLLLLKVVMAGLLFGGASFIFIFLSHGIKDLARRTIKNPWLIPVAGAGAVIAISYALGTFDYLGLGVVNPDGGVSIVSAFQEGGATTWSWFWKLVLTAITLSTGFKGGEVTPLFFIGATLGNTLALLSGAPVDLLAALGFLAVFAGATNTPLACTIMGAELFGTHYLVYYAIACFAAYYGSGPSAIYKAQVKGRKWAMGKNP
jgi:H+/Cl- antiporter ClcA